jgi:type II secretory pathway component PulC
MIFSNRRAFSPVENPFPMRPGRGFFPRARFLLGRLFPWFERVLVVVVCWQAAGLVWWLFAPATLGPMPTPPRSMSGQSESRDAFLGWFGVEPSATDAPVVSDYTLMAVIAGRSDGVALLKGNDGKGIAVLTGNAVDSGNRLVSVDPGSATIERDGVRQQIKLPEQAAPPVISRVLGGVPAASTRPAAAVKAVHMTHGQMTAVVRGSNVAGRNRGLSNAPDGGIRIDQVAAQPFAQILQLKDGDVLKSINQRPLAKLADISLVFSHFGQSPSVTLELIRGGVPLTQRYDIQP